MYTFRTRNGTSGRGLARGLLHRRSLESHDSIINHIDGWLPYRRVGLPDKGIWPVSHALVQRLPSGRWWLSARKQFRSAAASWPFVWRTCVRLSFLVQAPRWNQQVEPRAAALNAAVAMHDAVAVSS